MSQRLMKVTVEYEGVSTTYDCDTFVAQIGVINEDSIGVSQIEMGKFSPGIIEAIIKTQMESQSDLLATLDGSISREIMSNIVLGIVKADLSKKIMQEDYNKGVRF